MSRVPGGAGGEFFGTTREAVMTSDAPVTFYMGEAVVGRAVTRVRVTRLAAERYMGGSLVSVEASSFTVLGSHTFLNPRPVAEAAGRLVTGVVNDALAWWSGASVPEKDPNESGEVESASMVLTIVRQYGDLRGWLTHSVMPAMAKNGYPEADGASVQEKVNELMDAFRENDNPGT